MSGMELTMKVWYSISSLLRRFFSQYRYGDIFNLDPDQFAPKKERVKIY